jgi:predicted lipoprotein with Yx(FWY)xxD motif
MALYTTAAEAGGKIICTSGCTSFWKPVTVSGAKPTATAGAGKVGEIKRPDGTTQATVNGKPVYTFAQDSPGKVNGNGFTDHFDGHTFIWDVVKASGTAASGTGSTAPASSTPAPAPSSGGGSAYSY